MYLCFKLNIMDKILDDLLTKSANFIKPLEGFYETPYWDFKQYTNGYGTVAKSEDEKITKDEATIRLKVELNEKYNQLVKFNFWKKLGENQKIALISLVFNVGIGAVIKGTRMYNTLSNIFADMYDVQLAFTSNCNAGGKFSQGLYNRRLKEYNKFAQNNKN